MKNHLVRGLALCIVVALAACGQTIGGIGTLPVPKTADQSLFESQVTLDALVKEADAYARLPRCGSAGASPGLCSSAALAKQASVAAYKAQDAITQARAAVLVYSQLKNPTAADASTEQASLAAATTALLAVSDIANMIQKK